MAEEPRVTPIVPWQSPAIGDVRRGVQGLPRSSSHARLIGCCRVPTTLPAHCLAPCECGDDGCTLGRLEVA
eukprot:5863319-Prymnesium_polylepis.1